MDAPGGGAHAAAHVAAAFCRAHYGGILTAAGRWDEAEAQLVESTRQFDRGLPRAAALIRLADLRLRQGRLEEADQLLKGLDTHPDAVRTLAALHLARGETALARDLLERRTVSLDDNIPRVGETTMIGPLLGLLVEVHLAEGNLGDADRAAQRLGRIAEAQRGPYLTAAAALATGRVCVASGRGDARSYLHSALEGFARAQLPIELATTRLEMARALAEHSPEVAIRRGEGRAGGLRAPRGRTTRRRRRRAASFTRRPRPDRPQGHRGADEARERGPPADRRRNVQFRIGAAVHHPQTIKHHVGNMLSKLGMRNRAEAAAYVTRHKPAGD